MSRKKKNTTSGVSLDDIMKASRRGSREAEQEQMGPGFHATTRVHRSHKLYTRKQKHKGQMDG